MSATPVRPAAKAKKVQARVPGRPTQQAAAALRDICLEAALDEFFAHGFEGATIDGVAKRAKASRATVYRMFGNKEALFRAVHQWFMERRQSNLRALLEDDLQPYAMLVALIEKIYQDSVRPRDLAVTRLFVAESHRFPELTDSLFEHALFEPLIDYLRRQAELGIFDIQDPVEAAWDLTALAGGGIRMLITPPLTDPAAVRARAERLAALATKGWLRQEPKQRRRPARP